MGIREESLKKINRNFLVVNLFIAIEPAAQTLISTIPQG
jgi:hypothetical protein